MIVLILVQHGKGAEAGASLNNYSQTIFGSKGSKNFLVKLTIFIAILFFANCFIMGILNNKLQSNDIINILDKKENKTLYKKEEYNSKFDDIPIEEVKKNKNN
jgi:protein translocase SecG subunit